MVLTGRSGESSIPILAPTEVHLFSPDPSAAPRTLWLHLDLATFGARQSLRNSDALLALLGTALETHGGC